MRTVNSTFLAAAFAEETDEVFLALLEIHDPLVGDPIRVVDDMVNFTHQGHAYTAFPFKFVPPIDDGESAPTMSVSISNVSKKLIGVVRKMRDPITVRAKIVMASDPDKAIMDIPRMKLREATVNPQTIEFNVMSPVVLGGRWPAHSYNRSNWRGIFK